MDRKGREKRKRKRKKGKKEKGEKEKLQLLHNCQLRVPEVLRVKSSNCCLRLMDFIGQLTFSATGGNDEISRT